jgi:hypothetical protein
MHVKLLFAAALAATCAFAQVKITATATQVDVMIDGKPYTTLFHGPDTTKPYLHPLRTAQGQIVTRRYPMENVDGEKRDHPHHRGLWFSHGDVNGWDFWANERDQKGVGKGRGEIVLKKLGPVKSGKKQGSLEASYEWKDGTGKALLADTRRITFHAGGPNRIIDYEVTLKALEPCTFGDTKEGVFALRLRKELDETNTGTMTSSTGAAKEKNVWGKAFPWVDYVGTLDGAPVGIAFLDHPKNPRHPTYWHARGYGLFASNIFGLRDFTRDKTKDGAWTLKPGEGGAFRFRVVIHPGATAEANIAKLFEDFAATK